MVTWLPFHGVIVDGVLQEPTHRIFSGGEADLSLLDQIEYCHESPSTVIASVV